MRSSLLSSVLLIGAVSVGLVACGGGGPNPDRVAQGVLEAALGELAEEGFEIDIDGDGEPRIGVRTGDGQMQMGDNLPRPEWLPSGFPLPDGMNISYSVVDIESGESGLGGTAPGDLASVRDEMVAKFQAYGARLLNDEVADLRSLTFVLPDSRVVDLVLLQIAEDGGTQITLAIRTEEDLERVERVATGPRESTGRATAVVGQERFATEGTCQIGADYAEFITFGDPTAGQIMVTAQNGQGFGSITVIDSSGEFRMWMASDGTVGAFDDSSIRVSGTALDVASPTAEGGIPITIEVSCD